MELDTKQIKREFEDKQLIDVHKKLTQSRRFRRLVLGHLLTALLMTVVFGTLENPFQYTLSAMGNRFAVSHRVFFIVWGTYVGFAFFVSIFALHRLENYNKPKELMLVFLAWVMLFISTLIPSLPSMPFWKFLHIVTAVLFSLLLAVGSLPFFRFVSEENPRLRKPIYAWLLITYGGGAIWVMLLGNKGIFEMWAIAIYLILMMYISMMLFEESIIKYCVEILKDEKDLNLGIEKAYAQLDPKEKADRQSLLQTLSNMDIEES